MWSFKGELFSVGFAYNATIAARITWGTKWPGPFERKHNGKTSKRIWKESSHLNRIASRSMVSFGHFAGSMDSAGWILCRFHGLFLCYIPMFTCSLRITPQNGHFSSENDDKPCPIFRQTQTSPPKPERFRLRRQRQPWCLLEASWGISGRPGRKLGIFLLLLMPLLDLFWLAVSVIFRIFNPEDDDRNWQAY